MRDVIVTNLTLGMTILRSTGGYPHVWGKVIGLTMDEVVVEVKNPKDEGDGTFLDKIPVKGNGLLPNDYSVAHNDMRYLDLVNHKDSDR